MEIKTTEGRKKSKQYLSNLRDKGAKALETEYVNHCFDNGSSILGLGVMKILRVLDKREEPEEYLPQEAGIKSFKCKKCEGDGYVEIWDSEGKMEVKVIKDCDVCKGEGRLEIKVIDKRKKSKDKDLYYTIEY